MILQTKLHRPQPTPDLVCRLRLHERMDAGAPGRAILVAAPAGYGKSVLVSHWAELRPEPCAWLALDESDNDFAVFLEYLIAAVRTAIPDACPETDDMLRSADRPPVQRLAHSLVNELDAIETPFLLVLDDLHNISDRAIFELLDLLLKHPPRSLVLVLVTRRDPPLELPALLARGQLLEMRLQDLVFRDPETEALLKCVAGISVSAEALANLQTNIEGWAAGLRLILLILRKRHDPAEFLMGLEGGTQIVQQYLIQEVLAQQSPAVRHFLLRTSILDRFCVSLCDAVCGSSPDGAEMSIHARDFVRDLIAGGLFTIQLDFKDEWYRYHHLFQNLLRQQLECESDTESIAELHSRASQWFESQHLIPEAIDHALWAGDTTAAAEVAERSRSAALDSDRWFDLEAWLRRLPEEMRKERIGLLMTEAWVSSYRGQLANLAAILDRAEALDADEQSSAERIYFRGMLSLWHGDGARSAACFDEVLRLVPEADSWIRAHASGNRCLALHMSGRTDDAIQGAADMVERNALVGGLVWSRGVGILSFLHLIRGELPEAEREGRRVREARGSSTRGFYEAWSDFLVGNVALRRFELDKATQHLESVASQCTLLHGLAGLDALAGAALACQMTGRSKEADEWAGRALEMAGWSGALEQLQIAESCEARIALLRGDRNASALWQQSLRQKPAASHALYFIEIPAINECRVLAVTAGEAGLREAHEKLADLWDGLGAIHNTCQQIEIAPIRALILHRQGQTEEALEVLEQSLAMAAPGGWVRPYVELGAPMADLLERLPRKTANSALVRGIQAALRGGARKAPSSNTRALHEDLTNRERDVLDLLAERLRDKEIAARLVISPETVKTHLRSLYTKLDCGDRRRAVAKARKFGLLP